MARLQMLSALAGLGTLLLLSGGCSNEDLVTGSNQTPDLAEASGSGGGGGGGGGNNPPPSTSTTLRTLALFPSRLGGGGPATGRVTFNRPAADAARVLLSSSRPDIVQVPDEVVVEKNKAVADFPVTTSPVGANVAVTITGSACCGGAGTAAGTLTVTTDPPPPPDVVRVQSASFQPGGRGGTLRVRATSTSATAILSVFRDGGDFVVFVLPNLGGGRYEGSKSFSGTKPQTVTVRSNLGGEDTAPVN